MENLSEKIVMITPEETYREMILWIKNYFKESGGKKAVIGLSGGKDSTVCAKMLAEALGKENVFGVLMPQHEQHDIDVSLKVAKYLGIDFTTINIGDTVDALLAEMCTIDILRGKQRLKDNKVLTSNLPARIRMSTLYAVSSLFEGGRVCNTCNYSEDYVGYATKFGDGAGDFSLLQNLTVRQVKELGRFAGIPEEFIEKIPEDGLSGLTDEENLGFTYEELDDFILGDSPLSEETFNKVSKLHFRNKHKLLPMPTFLS